MHTIDFNLKFLKNDLVDFCTIILYKAFLDLSYILFVNKEYTFLGFDLDLDYFKMIESWILLFLSFFSLNRKEKKISEIGLQLLFLLMIVPILSLYWLLNSPRIYLYFVILSFAVTIVCIKIFPNIRIAKIKGSSLYLVIALSLFIVFIYTVLIFERGVPNLMALDFLKVYEIRRMESFSVPLMGYFVVWLSNVLNCFFIGLAWHKRKFVLLSLIILLQFLLYLMMAHKSYLFSPILLLFLFYFVKVKKFFQLSVAALAGIIFISLILFELNVTVTPASLFIRRTLFVPAKNSFLYYDYFSDHEKMYLSHSKIGFGLYKNPYEDYKLPYTKFMGLIYHDNPNMSMNTGYMGDAYMNFGFGGMLIFSVILALTFTLADSLSQNTNIFVVMGATVIPITNLVNGGLFTNMLTGGFLLSLLIVFLYDKEDGIGG